MGVGGAGGFVLGVLVALIACRWLIANNQPFAAKLGLVPRTMRTNEDDEDPPAVEPESIPVAVDPTEQREIDSIPHQQLRRLVQTLRTWAPKRHQDEDGFQKSFLRPLLKSGYPAEAVERHPRSRWTARDRAPPDKDRNAIPDFRVDGVVIVEIKRNITGSGVSDRSLGQMQRYSFAFRRTGPALLVVCNEFDDGLRIFVEKTIRGWKATGSPVMAYFARHPSLADGDDEFPAGSWG